MLFRIYVDGVDHGTREGTREEVLEKVAEWNGITVEEVKVCLDCGEPSEKPVCDNCEDAGHPME